MTKISFTDTAPVSSMRKTAEGFAVAEVRVARTGVQLYAGSELGLNDRKTVRVYRPEDAVFGKAAIKSYAHRPITMGHPKEMVNSDNWKDTAVGHTGAEVIRDGEFVRVPLILMDAATVKAVESGTRELSMGYTAEIELKHGFTDSGEEYDAIQTNMKMNHLAIVAKARGGSELRIGDNGGTMADAIETKTVVVDGLQIITTQDGLETVEKLTQAIALRDSELAKKDAEIARLSAAVVSDAELDKRVEARASLITKARKLFGDADCSGKSEAEIRRMAVTAKLGDEKVTGKTEAYIDAMFDVLVDTATHSADPFRQAIQSVSGTQFKMADADKAYADNVAHLRDAWKQPAKEA